MKIFCCHSSTDKDIVKPIAKALLGDRHEVFLDEWSLLPGDSLIERIPAAIAESGTFVFFLSEAAKRSNWCSRELAIAVSRMIKSGRIRIFAFRLERVDPPLAIDDMLYIDAVTIGYPAALDSIRRAAKGELPEPQAAPYEDIEVTRIPVNVPPGKELPAPYHAAVRIRAKRFQHLRLYVRLTASAPVLDEHVATRENSQGGMFSMIASFSHGHTFEYTEGPPGLEVGIPWVLVVFSHQPVAIVRVEVREENPFNDVVQRAERAKGDDAGS